MRFVVLFILLAALGMGVIGCASPSNPAAPAVGETAQSEAGADESPATAEPAAEADGESQERLFPLTIVDAAGQEFTFDESVKIGCLWYGCHEGMADMEIPAHGSGLPEADAEKIFYSPAGPPVHLVADTGNPELWAATEVDLILTRVPIDPSHDALGAAAPVFYLHHPSYGESSQTGYQAYIENARLLGALTGRPDAAQAAIVRFERTLDRLRTLATPETAELRIAVMFSGDGYRVTSPGNPFCAVLEEVGLGQCVGEGDATWELNAEEFLNLDPDWIVYQSGPQGVSFTERTDPVWSQLTAVQEGRVFDALGNRYYCCSMRGLIHALQEYVHYIVPEAGISAPGLHVEFDPTQSPLVQAD